MNIVNIDARHGQYVGCGLRADKSACSNWFAMIQLGPVKVCPLGVVVAYLAGIKV